MVEVDAGQAEMNAHQAYFHVSRMRVRRGPGFGRVACVDEDLRISAGLDIGHAVRVQREVACAGDVALEGGNTTGGIDARDVGEVNLVGAVAEAGDRVRP